jgi:hypothetical protein
MGIFFRAAEQGPTWLPRMDQHAPMACLGRYAGSASRSKTSAELLSLAFFPDRLSAVLSSPSRFMPRGHS